MFSDPGALREQLRLRLTPLLPTDWKIVDHLRAAAQELGPVVYFEFTEFSSSAGGQPLTREAVAASVDVVVTTAKTDDEGIAETDVDRSVHRLVGAVVSSEDLFFSTARKVRLEAGSYAWRVSLTAITRIEPTEGA